MELRLNDEGKFSIYEEPYITIEVKFKEDYERLEYLVKLGRAVERATKKGTAWVYLENTEECTYPSEEDIQHLLAWEESEGE